MKRLILSAVLLVVGLMAVQAQKFVLVDMEYIMKQIPAVTQANQQMEALSKQWQEAVEAKANEAKALYEAYQKSAATLSAAQKTAQEDAIVAKEKEAAELRKQYFGPEGELMKKRQELMGPVQDAIYNAVKAIATERGYDVVIDRASAQSMIFASPRIDISKLILYICTQRENDYKQNRNFKDYVEENCFFTVVHRTDERFCTEVCTFQICRHYSGYAGVCQGTDRYSNHVQAV